MGKESDESKRRREGDGYPSSHSPSRDRDKERRKRAKLEEKRRKKAEERRANETPEERLARKRKTKHISELFGYTNESNPFGDANLTQQFAWRKKTEKEDTGAPTKTQIKMRHQENIGEIVKVRQRRHEAEMAAEEMERLRAEESRLREQSQHAEWQDKEEFFHLQQARMRSKLRITGRRDKPIDRMAKNWLLYSAAGTAEEQALAQQRLGGVKYSGGDGLDLSGVDVELKEPYKLFEERGTLKTSKELRELQGDINTYLELAEKEEGEGGEKALYWRALLELCMGHLEEVTADEAGAEASLHKSIREDVPQLICGVGGDFQSLRKGIEERVNKGEGDTDYWSAVLRILRMEQAKARLSSMHKSMLERQLKRFESMGRDTKPSDGKKAKVGSSSVANASENIDDSKTAIALEHAAVQDAARETEDEDQQGGDVMGPADEVHIREQSQSSGKPHQQWMEKYRPRKPRYFNRVKTGYDWNKYNQTHYDHDNPPPKSVQGYKFNIFYPDLIEKTVAPSYRLEKPPISSTCIQDC